jgi:hypothetical protein
MREIIVQDLEASARQSRSGLGETDDDLMLAIAVDVAGGDPRRPTQSIVFGPTGLTVCSNSLFMLASSSWPSLLG